MTDLIVVPQTTPWHKIKALVLDSVSSPITKRVYNLGLDEFFAWFAQEPRNGFTKATVSAWRVSLEARGLGAVSINVRITAVRKLAVEAADNGLLAPELASGITRVKGVASKGVRLGNWLTVKQAQTLLNTPDASTTRGLRDRAILAVLLGCGLRRSECAAMTFGHVQQRDGRWCIVDLVGKHGRVRTIPMPAWVKMAIDAWTTAAGISAGPVFRPVNRGGQAQEAPLNEKVVWQLLQPYTKAAGVPGIAPHDCRRTCAKLCRAAGGELEQIQLLLGHASVQTTERYLGTKQDLVHAPNDGIKLEDDDAANAVPPVPENPASRPGDLWLCGKHRVLCGDSTSADDVARLLGDRKPLLMVCDPPYGIELDSEWRDRAGLNGCGAAQPSYLKHRTPGHTETTISGDTRADWSEAFELVPSIQIAYVWHASVFTREVLNGLLRIGFLYPQQIIWNKGRTVLTRTHYWYQHEPCWYVRKKNAPWFGKAGENSTVWDSASPKFIMGGSDEEKFDHPTQKPVDLMRRPILNHTKRGQLVYEPFLGSGTTLAAAELTERVCLGIELDPKYVDVIVQRWQTLAGKKAKLDGDGRTFEEIAAERKGVAG